MINKFGKRVEELLIEHDITKYKLSKDTGISKSIISDYCKGKVQPTADIIIVIAEYFDVTTDYLLGVENFDGSRKNYHFNNSLNQNNGTINFK